MAQQLWMTNSLGGFLANDFLSKTIRHAASPIYAFRQFVTVKEALGARRGSTVLFDKVSRITTSGGTIAETSTMPENNYTLTQDSVVVNDYGNSIPLTGKLELLSEYDVNNVTTVVLRDDEANVIDRAAAAQFTSADLIAVCTTTASTVFTTNGVATAVAGVNMSDKNVRDIVDYMKIKKIPKFGNGKDFACLASVNSLRGLYDYLQAIMQYTTPEFMYNGEVGRYYSTRFNDENNVLSNVKGTDSIYGEAVFLGNDAVLEAVALPEEIRYRIATDYGRNPGLAWIGVLGFKKMWDFSADAEEHEVFVTSG